MIAYHGYLCFVMILDDAQKKKDGEWRAADGRPTDRVSHRLSRVDSETPVSNCPLSLPKPASQRVYECGGSKMMLPSSSPTQPAPFGSFLLCKSHHTPRLSVCGSPPSCIQPPAIHSQARRGARRGRDGHDDWSQWISYVHQMATAMRCLSAFLSVRRSSSRSLSPSDCH